MQAVFGRFVLLREGARRAVVAVMRLPRRLNRCACGSGRRIETSQMTMSQCFAPSSMMAALAAPSTWYVCCCTMRSARKAHRGRAQRHALCAFKCHPQQADFMSLPSESRVRRARALPRSTAGSSGARCCSSAGYFEFAARSVSGGTTLAARCRGSSTTHPPTPSARRRCAASVRLTQHDQR